MCAERFDDGSYKQVAIDMQCGFRVHAIQVPLYRQAFSKQSYMGGIEENNEAAIKCYRS
ncbi:UNVERIFIED_CONTAM: hypothetical protein FKN15_066116 [Acipenser sinensis]